MLQTSRGLSNTFKYTISQLNNQLLSKNHISIGKELSFILNLDIGDNVTLMSSSGLETIIGNLPKQKTFFSLTPSGAGVSFSLSLSYLSSVFFHFWLEEGGRRGKGFGGLEKVQLKEVITTKTEESFLGLIL